MAVFPSRLSIDELPRVIPIQPGETACMLHACIPREHCKVYNSAPPICRHECCGDAAGIQLQSDGSSHN